MATGTYLLGVQGTVQGQYRENILCFQGSIVDPNDTLAMGNDLIGAWIAHAEAPWLAMFPGSYFVDLYSARRATPKPSAVAKRQYQSFSQAGTLGLAATSYNLCPSIFLVPPMGTKSGGRIFLPCCPQGQIVNNAYQAPFQTAMNNFMNTVTAGIAGAATTWTLAIFSRKLTSTSLVFSWGLSERLGFQGRRRSPVGSA